MKSFLDHIKEEVLPTVQVADGGLDISKPAVRAAINAAIAGVVSQPAVTPYVVFNRLSKLLAQYHIVLPKRFLEGDKGVEVFELKQFGHKMGMTDSGEFVTEVPATHYLFLQYGILSPFGITYAKPVVGGMFKVMARLVDKEELDKLIDMAEITMKEEAECMQAISKANAPKEPMHDVTSDEKKKGNKAAVATSEKKSLAEASTKAQKQAMMRVLSQHPDRDLYSRITKQGAKERAEKKSFASAKKEIKTVKEELSHGARELTLHADNDQQLHRSSHQPIIKNLQRKHAKGTYDHDKATKLWKYHADRAAKSYEKQHGGKFSVADRKAAASHFADSARDEHGFGSVKEEKNDLKDACWKGYTAKGLKKKGGKMVPNCVPVEEATEKDRVLSKIASTAISKGHPIKKLPAGRAEYSTLPKTMAKGFNLEKGRWSGHGKFDESFGVYRKGGSIGEKPSTEPHKTFDNQDDAKAHAKSMNKLLSPGEKKYYRIKYHVKPLQKEETLDEVSLEKAAKTARLRKIGAERSAHASPYDYSPHIDVQRRKAGKTVDRIERKHGSDAAKKVSDKMNKDTDKVWRGEMEEEKGDRITPGTGIPNFTQKNLQDVAKDLGSGQGGATFAMKSNAGNPSRQVNVSTDPAERGNKFTNRAPLDEKAPPGAKFKRMAKHIKAGYAEGGLTDVEKRKAFGATWKAYKREKGE